VVLQGSSPGREPVKPSDEVRFHSIKSAFEPDELAIRSFVSENWASDWNSPEDSAYDEPEITEHVADAIALGLEALLFVAVVVIVAFVMGAIF
jgi:hypothetical protein